MVGKDVTWIQLSGLNPLHNNDLAEHLLDTNRRIFRDRLAAFRTRDLIEQFFSHAASHLAYPVFGDPNYNSGRLADHVRRLHLRGRLLRKEELREIVNHGGEAHAADRADSGRGEGRGSIVRGDGASPAKRRDEHAHHARAEKARAPRIAMLSAVIHVVIGAVAEMVKDLPEDERNEQEEETDGGDCEEYCKGGEALKEIEHWQWSLEESTRMEA